MELMQLWAECIASGTDLEVEDQDHAVPALTGLGKDSATPASGSDCGPASARRQGLPEPRGDEKCHSGRHPIQLPECSVGSCHECNKLALLI